MKANRLLAEGMGAFALVFAGCGAITVSGIYGGVPGHIGISLVFGLIVLAMICSVGNISGAHINPAVTLGFMFAGRFGRKEVLPYIGSQILGSVVAAGILRYLFPEHQ